ncbi:MAG: hypothetical protein P8179_23775 [Candidatus Thiodiazotropha sp.]|jgi:hypothetical protein
MIKILAAVVFVVILLSFILASPFKNDLHFNGITYSHTKNVAGGEITNHFYTPSGSDLHTAKDFIQILEISDKIPQSDWSRQLQALYNQYNLKKFQDNEFELTGSGNRSGIYFNSYAAKMMVKDKEYMVLYVSLSNTEQNQTSRSKKIDMLSELQSIRFD